MGLAPAPLELLVVAPQELYPPPDARPQLRPPGREREDLPRSGHEGGLPARQPVPEHWEDQRRLPRVRGRPRPTARVRRRRRPGQYAVAHEGSEPDARRGPRAVGGRLGAEKTLGRALGRRRIPALRLRGRQLQANTDSADRGNAGREAVCETKEGESRPAHSLRVPASASLRPADAFLPAACGHTREVRTRGVARTVTRAAPSSEPVLSPVRLQLRLPPPGPRGDTFTGAG